MSVGRSILTRVFEDVEDDIKKEMKSIAVSEDDEDTEGQEGITLDDAEIIRIEGIISKCDGLITLEQQKLCMSEVHGWAEKNLSAHSMNVVGELIQSSSMSEMENVTSLVLEKVDKIDNEIESIGDDKGKVF
ncbi:hypothetical protein PS928_06593 [Pseudomonas fluorescens]|uniref:Uncharacterized protein n=2 Tax=Pseudomonas fluorescens TaxID=294 RepID=A0A5E7VUB7_PSEFL|nr:hypothetical protein PS928_06593 [Pseudomonas fluorescens]